MIVFLCIVLGWQVFLFLLLDTSNVAPVSFGFQNFWCTVSHNLIIISLYNLFLCPVLVTVFSLSLAFTTFTVIHVGVVFFLFSSLVVQWVFCLCQSMFSIRFGNFGGIDFKNIVNFFVFSWYSTYSHAEPFALIPHNSWNPIHSH